MSCNPFVVRSIGIEFTYEIKMLVIVFHREGFQLLPPSRYWEMIEMQIFNIFFKTQADKG